jgi:serine kinase of HPr protein (carbohydrate metabolism regulator)
MATDIASHFASAVSWPEGGVLLRGASGSGKSDLALHLIRRHGARLVADDRVQIDHVDEQLYLSCPKAIIGLIEVRGLGLLKLPHDVKAVLKLIVEIVPIEDMPRLPEPNYEMIEGHSIPKLRLSAFDVSAGERIALAFQTIGLNGFPEDGILDLTHNSEIKNK